MLLVHLLQIENRFTIYTMIPRVVGDLLAQRLEKFPAVLLTGHASGKDDFGPVP